MNYGYSNYYLLSLLSPHKFAKNLIFLLGVFKRPGLMHHIFLPLYKLPFSSLILLSTVNWRVWDENEGKSKAFDPEHVFTNQRFQNFSKSLKACVML